jgi:hypothetical protein
MPNILVSLLKRWRHHSRTCQWENLFNANNFGQFKFHTPNITMGNRVFVVTTMHVLLIILNFRSAANARSPSHWEIVAISLHHVGLLTVDAKLTPSNWTTPSGPTNIRAMGFTRFDAALIAI